MNFVDFPIGPFLFSTGGIIFLAGLILATWMLMRTVHEKGLSLSFLSHHLVLFGIFAFLIGRLGATGRFWSYFESIEMSFWTKIWLFLEKFILFWHGGIDTFWTAIAILVTFFALALFKQENLWKWMDAFVLPTTLLLIFWNLGAFFSAWDYGKPVSDGFWFGITYDVQKVRYSLPIHPVQIYALIYYSYLFFWGFKKWRSGKTSKDGVFFSTMVFFVFLGNGFLEFFRGDPVSLIEFGDIEMRMPQVVSFVIALGVSFFLICFTHPEFLQHRKERKIGTLK